MQFNISKINNGFIMNEIEYLFVDFIYEDRNVRYYYISSEQVHVGTDKGIILLDTSVGIDGNIYKNIEEFTNKLFEVV